MALSSLHCCKCYLRRTHTWKSHQGKPQKKIHQRSSQITSALLVVRRHFKESTQWRCQLALNGTFCFQRLFYNKAVFFLSGSQESSRRPSWKVSALHKRASRRKGDTQTSPQWNAAWAPSRRWCKSGAVTPPLTALVLGHMPLLLSFCCGLPNIMLL